MKLSDLFKLSTRMFKARTSRTLLTVLGMSVGISAILFLVSLGYGLQNTLLEKITTSDSLLTLDVSAASSGGAQLDKDTVGEMKAYPGVDEISTASQVSAQGKLDDLSADLTLIGTDPAYLRLGGINMETGTSLLDSDPEGIVVGSSVGQSFGLNPDQMVGKEMTFVASIAQPANGDNNNGNLQSDSQKININGTFKIVGIVEDENNVVYINSGALSDLNIANFNQAKVRCHSSSVMTSVRDKIISSGFSVSALSDTVDQANKVFGVIQLILMLFGVIALIVSAIGMFNTMTITLLERTEEIGIMKSIGASDMGISLMFIMESTIMGFFGGLGGVVIGYLAGKIINLLVNLIAKSMGGQAVSLFYSPLWFVAAIIIFAGVVGMLTGIIPAKKASKIDPLDALRYK